VRLDGQSGTAASFQGFREFFFLRAKNIAVTITKAEAEQIARKYVKTLGQTMELVLLVDQTIERSFGWIFFYDSKRYIETGDIRHALAGNAPVIVTKADGQIHETGTAYPLEHYLKAFSG
jgi:hypothetical protein